MANGDGVKGDNFGTGLSKETFGRIVGSATGAGAKGTKDEQIALLLELAREEHAALHPGLGTTGVVQATLKFLVVEEASRALADAGTPSQATAAFNKLVPGIRDVGELWKVGPVRVALFGSE